METANIETVAIKFIDTLRSKSRVFQLVKNDFESFTTNADKAKFAVSLLDRYNQIPDQPLVRLPKNNETSKELRMKGNELFEKKTSSKNSDKKNVHLINAIEFYNEAICWAEWNEGDDLSIGYANRATVYFELNEFEMCLDNILLARISGYPERLMTKLVTLENDCRERVQRNAKDGKKTTSNITKLQTLKLKPNPRIPFIAECLELKQSEQYGKYVITNSDLQPGQIVCIEEPSVASLTKRALYQRCSNCLKENFLNLIPCPSCTTAMFCNDKCLNESLSGVHAFVCPISNYYWEHFESHELTLNLVLKAFSTFDTVRELEDFHRKNDKSNVTVFSFDHRTPLTAIEKYHLVHSLPTNEENRPFDEMFVRSAMIGHLYKQLIAHTKFKEILKREEDHNLLLECIFRFMQIYSLNSNHLEHLDSKMEERNYGVGIFPFCSRLNHSCAPNVAKTTFDNKLVFYVLRVIKKGQQLFDCYLYDHLQLPKDCRQHQLQWEYTFTCQCEACENDYPGFKYLPIARLPRKPKELELSLEFALKMIDRYCSYLAKYDCHYPCVEVAEAQQCLAVLMYLLFNDADAMLNTKVSNRKQISLYTINPLKTNKIKKLRR